MIVSQKMGKQSACLSVCLSVCLSGDQSAKSDLIQFYLSFIFASIMLKCLIHPPSGWPGDPKNKQNTSIGTLIMHIHSFVHPSTSQSIVRSFILSFSLSLFFCFFL